jgi:hypothetical protein
MKYESLVNYLKSHTLLDVNKMLRWHKGLPEYEPYWTELLFELKALIKQLEDGGVK